MIEVELRTFIKPEKYKELIEKYNNILHTEKQVTTYFDCPYDFRLMRTKTYTQLWLKAGAMHDSAREERVVKIDNKYRDDLLDMLDMLGYKTKIKWYRTRNITKIDDIDLCLDYTVGYGYILEVEKQVEDESKVDMAKIELGNFIASLNIDISDKSEFSEKFSDYTLNWDIYTRDIDESKYM